MRRITFNEITKNAVKASLKTPRDIDMDLVDAQQARRVLDRMVGYRISPLLWAKVKRGLSAGRVQSVALRIIADREEEINAFIPEEYWSLDAILKVKGEKRPLTAKFYGTEKKKMTIHTGFGKRNIRSKRYQKGRAYPKSAASVYNQHFAAGGSKGAQLRYTEDDAYCTAAV